jgi:hypothetical protein
VLKSVGDVRVVSDTGRDSRREGGKSSCAMSEEEFQVGIAIKDTGEDKTSDSL